MTKHRNNAIIVKRDRPKEIQLPNGKHVSAKCKSVDQNALPVNITIVKT